MTSNLSCRPVPSGLHVFIKLSLARMLAAFIHFPCTFVPFRDDRASAIVVSQFFWTRHLNLDLHHNLGNHFIFYFSHLWFFVVINFPVMFALFSHVHQCCFIYVNMYPSSPTTFKVTEGIYFHYFIHLFIHLFYLFTYFLWWNLCVIMDIHFFKWIDTIANGQLISLYFAKHIFIYFLSVIWFQFQNLHQFIFIILLICTYIHLLISM